MDGKEGFDEPPKQEFQTEAQLFDQCGDVQDIFSRLKELQQSGALIKGYNPEIFKTAITQAIDDLRNQVAADAKYLRGPQVQVIDRIDKALANRGVSRTNGLRLRLIAIILANLANPILDRATPINDLYDKVHEPEGFQRRIKAMNERAQAAGAQATTEQARREEFEEAFTEWKRSWEQSVLPETELSFPEEVDQEQLTAVRNDIEKERQGSLRRNVNLNDMDSVSRRIVNLLRDSSLQYSDYLSTNTQMESADKSEPGKVHVRHITLQVPDATRAISLVSIAIVSPVDPQTKFLEEPDRILGATVWSVDGQRPQAILNNKLALRQLHTQLVNFDNLILSKTGIDLHLRDQISPSTFQDSTLPDSFRPPQQRLEDGQHIDPRTGRAVQRDSAYGRQLHQRGYLR